MFIVYKGTNKFEYKQFFYFTFLKIFKIQISKGSNTLFIINMLCIYLQRIGYI